MERRCTVERHLTQCDLFAFPLAPSVNTSIQAASAIAFMPPSLAAKKIQAAHSLKPKQVAAKVTTDTTR